MIPLSLQQSVDTQKCVDRGKRHLVCLSAVTHLIRKPWIANYNPHPGTPITRSSPVERDSLAPFGQMTYWWLATWRLCTPANRYVPTLTLCGTHHMWRMKPFWLRIIRRLTKSNTVGVIWETA